MQVQYQQEWQNRPPAAQQPYGGGYQQPYGKTSAPKFMNGYQPYPQGGRGRGGGAYGGRGAGRGRGGGGFERKVAWAAPQEPDSEEFYEQQLGEVDPKSGTVVCARVSGFRGTLAVDLRRFTLGRGDDGEFNGAKFPTTTGIRLSPVQWAALLPHIGDINRTVHALVPTEGLEGKAGASPLAAPMALDAGEGEEAPALEAAPAPVPAPAAAAPAPAPAPVPASAPVGEKGKAKPKAKAKAKAQAKGKAKLKAGGQQREIPVDDAHEGDDASE